MRSLFLCLFLASFPIFGQPTTIVIAPGLHHLGEKEVKAFPPANQKPENPRLDRTFESESNPSEWTLQLDQRDVTDDWRIELNRTRIARLHVLTPTRTAYFSVPTGAVLEGQNKFSIIPSNPADDVLVGKIELIPKALRDVRKLGHVILSILDGASRQPVPVRITIANREQIYADLFNVQPALAAVRGGFLYAVGGTVEFDVPEGEWIISATRGMEWSKAVFPMHIFIGQTVRETLAIYREVDTTGFVAADTHLHTFTYSGHGDASIDERVVTLAGEGIELAVATDHHHYTDYKPRQAALGLSPYYTSVVGNEISTGNGHFNGFPFSLDAQKPDRNETNWVRLVQDIRDKGAQYVILNHPRWPAITNSPFHIFGLNRAEGSRTNGPQFTFDAMEVVNSTVPLKDPNFLLRDWFALWNRGERIWGVGSSDTHTVVDIPGQGRTYISSAAQDPASIDVDAVIKSMHAGNMSIAYGIFGRATANGGVTMGQMATPTNGVIDVLFHIGAPSWISPTQAVVYVNGLNVASTNVMNLWVRPGTAREADLKFKIPAPAHDAFLVCVAYGEALTDPAWPAHSKYTLAVTNPILIDADKDGKYRSPRDTARALLDKIKPLSLGEVEKAFGNVDAAIAVQMLAEAKLRLPAGQIRDWEKLVQKLAPKNELFQLYGASGQ